jgi:hypothetical protein
MPRTGGRTPFRQIIASQTDRETPCSIGLRPCRPRAEVARRRSAAEAPASARDRCTMPPCRSLSPSLVALAVELVQGRNTSFVNLPAPEPTRAWEKGRRKARRTGSFDHGLLSRSEGAAAVLSSLNALQGCTRNACGGWRSPRAANPDRGPGAMRTLVPPVRIMQLPAPICAPDRLYE